MRVAGCTTVVLCACPWATPSPEPPLGVPRFCLRRSNDHAANDGAVSHHEVPPYTGRTQRGSEGRVSSALLALPPALATPVPPLRCTQRGTPHNQR
jgi:hypothetical protein